MKLSGSASAELKSCGHSMRHRDHLAANKARKEQHVRVCSAEMAGVNEPNRGRRDG